MNLALGLVNRVWAQAEFEKSWRELAARLAAAPATSVRLAKQTLRASVGRTLEECLDAETAAPTAGASEWDACGARFE